MNNVFKQAVEEIKGEVFRLEIVSDDMAENPRVLFDGHIGEMVCWSGNYNLGDENNYNNPEEFLASLIEDMDNKEGLLKHHMEEEFSGVTIEEEDGEWTVLGNYFESKEDAEIELDVAKQEYLDEGWIELLSTEDMLEIVNLNKDLVILPLFLYDHSGITMSTQRFSCGWDSGQVGFICGKISELKKESGYKFETEQGWRDMLEKILKDEVKTYDQYLTGEVYGFRIVKEVTCKCCDHVKDVEVDSCWGFYGSDVHTNGIIDHIEEDLQPLVDSLKYV